MGKKNFNEKQAYILTKETIGMTIMLFSAIVAIILLTQDYVFGGLGEAVCTFMYGTFGYASYIIVALLAYCGEYLTFGKKLSFRLRPAVFVCLTVACLFLLFHAVSTRDYSLESYGAYLSQCYTNAAQGYAGYSFGGALCGIIVYPVAKLMTFIAAYVIFSILAVLTGYVSYLAIAVPRKSSAQPAQAVGGQNQADRVQDGGAVSSPAPETTDQTVIQPQTQNYYEPAAQAAATNYGTTAQTAAPNYGTTAQTAAPSYGTAAQTAPAYGTAATQPVAPQPSAQAHSEPQTAPRQSYVGATQPYQSVASMLSARTDEKHADEDKYSRENLGKKILFEPGEFSAESYRRNMIYNESSYFNHPVRNNDDYLRSFSSGGAAKSGSERQTAGGVPDGNTSYTQNYAQSADSTPAFSGAPSYIYGDNPVQNLGTPDIEETYNSYSVPSMPADTSDFDEGPSVSDEVSVIREEQPSESSDFNGQGAGALQDNAGIQSVHTSDNGFTAVPSERDISFRPADDVPPQQAESRNAPLSNDEISSDKGVVDREQHPFRVEGFTSPERTERQFRGEQITPERTERQFRGEQIAPERIERQFRSEQIAPERTQRQFGGEQIAPERNERQFRGEQIAPERNERQFRGEQIAPERTQRQFGGEQIAPERNERQSAAEQPSMPEQPGSQAPSRGDRNSIYNLFSASNPRLGGERNIEPDISALANRDRRADRGREQLFDKPQPAEEREDILGSVDGLVDVSERVQPEHVQPERIQSERIQPEHVQPERIQPEHIQTEHVQTESIQNVRPQSEEKAEPELVELPEPEEESIEEQTVQSQPILRDDPPATVLPARVKEEEPAKEKPRHVWKKYVRPSLDLLDDYPENANINSEEIEYSKQVICETFADFRIDSEIANVIVGPAITRYDVIIKDKTNIRNALKYRESVAMALMKENVNAYLNYSKGAISFEVPNTSRDTVGLKTILSSSQFINSKPNSLCFAFGKNLEGKVVCPDITKMPHLLVAGTTGSGKSVLLNSLIVSLIYKYGPEELRFILIDPKQVEFVAYDKLPHLMINEIIYDVEKSIKALNWAIKEMERRYALFKEMTEKGITTKNLAEYNSHLEEGEEKLPKIVIILDEFGDLMLQRKKDIESRIIRLVQKARACGIHLILATQRPSVDCITGLIKSNLTTRIGFKVNSFDDSRCIFDVGGAEKLLGKGDCYFRPSDSPELIRIQGCFIDTPELQRVTDFVKQNNECYFDQSATDFINTVEESQDSGSQDDGGSSAAEGGKIDDTFIKALKFCVTSNQASVSMIQRRFPIGYMKACKIIDWMENMNYVTQSEGSKPRKVLLSKEEFIKTYGDIDD